MAFNFAETAGISQSSSRPTLAPNAIHEVIFDGCESTDFDGVQNPGTAYHVLDIKFHNDSGSFTHRVWEPREADSIDREGAFGPQPSNVKAMMLLFKHLIDAVNPELSAQINSGEKQISASDWNGLRKLMVKATTPGIGKTTKIKLLKNNKGEAIFPYFANYSKAGKLYMSTNFIGDDIIMTTKELQRIEKESKATPTPMADSPKDNGFTLEASAVASQVAPASTDWDF